LRAREATRTLPIVILTGRGDEAERVLGFTVGADDYVVKPFSLSELLARVRAILRRSRPEPIADRLTAGDIVLDHTTQRVRRGSREVHLGPGSLWILPRLPSA
jgi:two-component system phosphate regulon response regulator PhoB